MHSYLGPIPTQPRHTRGNKEGKRMSSLDTYFLQKHLKVKSHFIPTPFPSFEEDSRVVGSVSVKSCLTKSGLQQGEQWPRKKKKTWLPEQSSKVLTGCLSTDEICCRVFTHVKPLMMVLDLFPSRKGTYAHSDICRISPDYEIWYSNRMRSLHLMI